ncbi:MAG: LytTR family DNA-binding domain-containing protein [Usitatibacter sp.]
MTALRVAIVDDEPLARARLRRLLQTLGGVNLEIACECADGDELLQVAAAQPLDALFLDIEMPGGDGFSVLDRWPGPRPVVVFVTAYGEHGVRAFDARAIDYLMKPVSPERLRETLDRAREAAAKAQPQGWPERIALPVGQRTQLVPIEEIDLIAAQGNYLEVRAARHAYLIRRTLDAFHAQLRPGAFVRLHRSFIVRIAAIREIRPAGSGRYRLELHDGTTLHSGRHYGEQVRALLDR